MPVYVNAITSARYSLETRARRGDGEYGRLYEGAESDDDDVYPSRPSPEGTEVCTRLM